MSLLCISANMSITTLSVRESKQLKQKPESVSGSHGIFQNVFGVACTVIQINLKTVKKRTRSRELINKPSVDPIYAINGYVVYLLFDLVYWLRLIVFSEYELVHYRLLSEPVFYF